MMMRRWGRALGRWRWAVFCLGCAVSLAFAQGAQAPAADDEVHQRELALAAQLRCLVCQNQSIAESNAQLAQDLRAQIRSQIAAGRSDAQIVQFMTERYGEFVLYRPRLGVATVLLWFGPLVFLAVAAVLIVRMRRAARARSAQPALTPGERARADRLLGEP